MKYLNTLNEASASFVVKEHSIKLGNSEECKMDFHIHPSAELMLVLSGEIILHVRGKEPEKISGGQCALVFPFQSHSYERAEGTEYFRFNFIASLAQTFFSQNENNVGERAVFPINIQEYLPFLNLTREGILSIYKVKGFLYNIIADYSKDISFVKRHISESTLSKAVSYINDHKNEKITLANVASALGYNEKYLSHSINNAAGFGFSTLLSTLRIEAAKHLLKTTDRTIVDIAMECGFGSERNFYRIFKNSTGYTPKDFRLTSPQKIVINDAIL